MSESNERKIWLVTIAVIVGWLVAADSARAHWPEQDKLLAEDGAANYHFGGSVCISDDCAIIGSPTSETNTSGSAYIFTPNDIDPNNWDQKAKLIASDSAADDRFGCSVCINGDYVIVGAVFNDDKGDNSGSAYIFKRSGTSWTEQCKLIASDGQSGDQFGHGVSINGNYAIVTAYFNDANALTDSGAVYIFAPNDVDPNQWDQQTKLIASDGQADDNFGYCVSFDGDYVIVGAFRTDANGLTDSGAAYIFKHSDVQGDPNWYEQAKLIASDGEVNNTFGNSVSIEGEFAIVGSRNDDDNGSISGSAYIFQRDGESWSQQQKLLPSDGQADDAFGHSVSISGDYLIVSANKDDDNGTNSGSAYIFQYDGQNWIERKKLLPSDGEAYDYFGDSVSIGENYAVLTAHWDDDNGSGSGSAYIFNKVCPIGDLDNNCWVDFRDFAIMANEWLQCN
jgi:hypothetical protein